MEFLYTIGKGFRPRRFLSTPGQNVIYDEEGEVEEMYMINSGTVGIGFTNYLEPIDEEPYKLLYFLTQYAYIGAYYVLHNYRSEFLYIA